MQTGFLGRFYFGTLAIGTAVLVSGAVGCQKFGNTGTDGEAGGRQQPTPRDFVSQMAEVVAKRTNVLGVDSVPAGRYQLFLIESVAAFTKDSGASRTFTVHYTHTLKNPGELTGRAKPDGTPIPEKDRDSIAVDDSELPSGVGYYVTLPLNLPLTYDAAGKTFSSRVFYQMNYSHGASDSGHSASWSSHDTASRGHNAFGAFRKTLEKTKGTVPYYAASLSGFASGKGYIGWIEKSPLSVPGLDLIVFNVFYPMDSSDGTHGVKLTFVKLP